MESKRLITLLASITMILVLVVFGCGPAAAPTPATTAPSPTEETPTSTLTPTPPLSTTTPPPTTAPPPVGISVGNLAPDFDLTDLSGQKTKLSQLLGKPVVLNFWATWCGPCKIEMPYIQQIYNDREKLAPGLVILAIDVGEPSATVKEFVSSSGYTFPVLLDTTNNTSNTYGIQYIPTTFFIDKSGIIRAFNIGSFPSRAEIEQKLTLISSPPATTTTTPPPTTTTPPSTTTPTGQGVIAFVSMRDGDSEIYVMNADGTNVVQLTSNTAIDSGPPSWSPDGKKIAFWSNRDGSNEIYVMNADGSNQTNISQNPANDSSPSWSPDGNKIAFSSNRDGNNEIYVMNADGSNVVRLTNNTAIDGLPVWSPDSKKIAFYSNRDGDSEIYVMNADGTNVVQLTTNTAEDTWPSWSPDGKKIAFYTNAGVADEIFVMSVDVTTVPPRGVTGVVRLTSNTAVDISPSWSPDGQKIAFSSNRDGNNEIYVMNADGSNQTNISNNINMDSFPAWSPMATAPTTTTAPPSVIPTQNVIRVISMTPASPSTLHSNEKVTVTLEYAIADTNGGRIWAQPSTSGSYTPNGAYEPSSVIPAGTGTITRFILVMSGSVKIDSIYLVMRNSTNAIILYQAQVPVEYSYIP